MQSTNDVDIAILGGGLAGLSLAVRLARPEFRDMRVLVIEPRSATVVATRDRTWCYWNTWATDHDEASQPSQPLQPFAAAISHRYETVSVRGIAHEVHDLPSQYPYEMLPSDAFFARARQVIEQSSNVQYWQGVSAENIRKSPPDIEIDTSAGVVRAKLVFDSRPVERAMQASLPVSAPPAFWQHFVGWEIEVVRPIFSPDTAMLMDFSVPQTPQDGVHFMYVLPTSTTHALIEDTWFTPQSRMAAQDYQKPDYAAHIRAYLAREYQLRESEVTIIYREAAVLPMDVGLTQAKSSVQTDNNIVPIGVAGGMARASTGYAFADTQRASCAIAAHLLARLQQTGSKDFLTKPVNFPPWRAPQLNWMDGIFLSVIATDPEGAPAIFESLFRRVSPDRLVRFLGGVPTALDILHVIAACPKIPFIAAAIRGNP